jgi:hypothetical protein
VRLRDGQAVFYSSSNAALSRDVSSGLLKAPPRAPCHCARSYRGIVVPFNAFHTPDTSNPQSQTHSSSIMPAPPPAPAQPAPAPPAYTSLASARYLSYLRSRSTLRALSRVPHVPTHNTSAYASYKSARATHWLAQHNVARMRAQLMRVGRVVGADAHADTHETSKERRAYWARRTERAAKRWEKMHYDAREAAATVVATGWRTLPKDLRDAIRATAERAAAFSAPACVSSPIPTRVTPALMSEPALPTAGLSGECMHARAAVAKSTLAEHVIRARGAYDAGSRVLLSRWHVLSADDVEGGNALVERVERIVSIQLSAPPREAYGGGPQAQLYRRIAARRFAAWRREQRAMEAADSLTLREAEHEMKRRRGHDLLLTGRRVGETAFAPFLFDNANNTMVWSSKISEKPSLRAAMLQKYSSPDPASCIDQKGLAHHHAETKELFHTRVMNRFT